MFSRVIVNLNKPPSVVTLQRMGLTLFALALLDVLLTSIGVLFVQGEERNTLIVRLAEWLSWGTEDQSIVLAVWLSKMTAMAIVLSALHFAIESKPRRDDRIMFWGLLVSLVVYVGVIASWVWYFVLALRLENSIPF